MHNCHRIFQANPLEAFALCSAAWGPPGLVLEACYDMVYGCFAGGDAALHNTQRCKQDCSGSLSMVMEACTKSLW